MKARRAPRDTRIVSLFDLAGSRKARSLPPLRFLCLVSWCHEAASGNEQFKTSLDRTSRLPQAATKKGTVRTVLFADGGVPWRKSQLE